MAKAKTDPRALKGWSEITKFLGQPISVSQRWAKSGMPVTRVGQHVYASPEELNRWLGRESAEPVQIATETTDLAADLRLGLSYVRKRRQKRESPTSVPNRKERR